MPLPYGWASDVDRDPVAGLAGGAAQAAARCAPVSIGERPLEEAEGEPARLRARSRGRAGRRRTGAASRRARGRVAEAARRRRRAAASGRRGRRRCPARPAAARRGTRDRRGARGRASERAAKRVRVVDELGEARAERLGARRGGRPRTRRRGPCVGWRRCGRSAVVAAVIGAASTGGASSACRRRRPARRAVAVALAERRACAPRRPRRSVPVGGREDSVAGRGVDDARRRCRRSGAATCGDPALGPDRHARSRPARWNVDGHPGRDAPVVLGRPAPRP